MEEIRKAIDTVTALEAKYDLSQEELQKLSEQLDDFKVYIPLIGRFSAGKSALLNLLLGFGDDVEVCREDIGVATALPTEVFYGEQEMACICRPEKEVITTDEYFKIRDELSTKNAEVVKLQIDSDQLKRFPSIALVDLPGLDSGYEVHDRAIEQYIRKSMSYVLVFPADELTIPKSMEPILHDLNTYDMPMCVVITKGNRLEGDEEERKQELKNALKKYFPDQEIPVFITEKEEGRVEEFASYLESMEQKAGALGKKFYTKRLEPEFTKVANYLTGYLKNMELSMSELEEQQDSLEHNIEELNGTVEKELGELNRNIPQIVDGVAGDVQAALSAQMESYVSDLIHDMDVANDVNETVRSTLAKSYQTRVMGRIKEHMDEIARRMTVGSANYTATLRIDMDKVCGKEFTGVGRTAAEVASLILGGPIIFLLTHVLTDASNEAKRQKRREAEDKIRQQLSSNVFPSVDKEVRMNVEMDLIKIIMEMRQTIEGDVAVQIESLQKSLAEVMDKKQKEDTEKEQNMQLVEADLKLLEDTEHELE